MKDVALQEKPFRLERAAEWDALLDAVASVPGGAFVRHLPSDFCKARIKLALAPFQGIALLAPETLSKPKARVAIIGDTRFLTYEGGRWLTLLARLFEPACHLELAVYATRPMPLSVSEWNKPLMLARPPKIVRSPFQNVAHKDDSLDAIVLFDRNGESHSELLSNPSVVEAISAGTPLLRGDDDELASSIAAEYSREMGYSVEGHASAPLQYWDQGSEYGPGAGWIRCGLHNGSTVGKPSTSLIDRVAKIEATITLLRKGKQNQLETSCIFGTVISREVGGKPCSIIQLSGSLGIDADSGRCIEADAARSWSYNQNRVRSEVLKLLPVESPLGALALRFQRAAWLAHVLPNAIEPIGVGSDSQQGTSAKTAQRDAEMKDQLSVSAFAPSPGVEPPRRTFRTRAKLTRSVGITHVIETAAAIGRPTDDPLQIYRATRKVLLEWLVGQGFKVDFSSDMLALESAHGDVYVESEPDSIFAVRLDNRKGASSGAIWRVEATLIAKPIPSIGVRVSQIRQREDAPPPSPRAPRLLVTLASDIGLHSAGNVLRAVPWLPTDASDQSRLLALLTNPKREAPVIILSGRSPGRNLEAYSERIAQQLAGIAHVVEADQHVTSVLTSSFGRSLSVWGYAARVYFPGFNASSDPFDHPVWNFQGSIALAKIADEICEEVCAVGVQRPDREERVPSFQTVRQQIAVRRVEQAVAKSKNQALSVGEQKDRLEIVAQEQEARIRSLEQDRNELTEQLLQSEIQNEALTRERNNAFDQIRRLQYRVRFADQEDGDAPSCEGEPPFPHTWDALESWVTKYGDGRLVLANQAAKEAAESSFADIPFAYRVLNFLVKFYIPMRERTEGNDAARVSCEHAAQELGIEVSAVGAAAASRRYKQEYKATFGERTIKLNQHVKNKSGGIDKTKVFRLYFAYLDGKIYVGSLPEHLTSSLTH